jgi:hypothetical protein
MSVTKPTGKPEPLAAALVVLLLLLLLGAAALLEVLLLLLLLLLLPHAASPRASTAVARALRPTGLIRPVTRSPFHQKLNGQP